MEEESVIEESVEEEEVVTISHEVITTLDTANFAPFTGKDLIVKQGLLTTMLSNSCLITGKDLIVKQGLLDNHAVKFMLHSGAT